MRLGTVVATRAAGEACAPTSFQLTLRHSAVRFAPRVARPAKLRRISLDLRVN
jgi:hypothetical protein